MSIGRIGAFHRARPEPGDNSQLLANIRLEIGAFLGHLGRNLDLGVKMADALFSLGT